MQTCLSPSALPRHQWHDNHDLYILCKMELEILLRTKNGGREFLLSGNHKGFGFSPISIISSDGRISIHAQSRSDLTGAWGKAYKCTIYSQNGKDMLIKPKFLILDVPILIWPGLAHVVLHAWIASQIQSQPVKWYVRSTQFYFLCFGQRKLHSWNLELGTTYCTVRWAHRS